MLGIQCEQTDMASALVKPTVQWGGNHTSNDRITTVMSASSRLKDVGSNPDSTSCHQLCDIRLVLKEWPRGGISTELPAHWTEPSPWALASLLGRLGPQTPGF